jgi:glycosyltransferase involved in cell wall biosynthesis
MNELRRVLVVSYFFPPDPAVGGLRISKFAEYLPEFGWQPTILTAHTVDGDDPGKHVYATPYFSPWKRRQAAKPDSDAHQPFTPSLRDRTRRGRVSQATYSALRHVLPMSSVRMPDATLGWVPYAVSQGKRLLGDHSFAAIFSSAGPPSSHIVAARLQRASGLPWIADYRDLWSDNHWDTRIGVFRRVERLYERRTLRNAAMLTSVGPAWAQRLAALHDKTTEVIYNGFDPADYPAARPQVDDFVITYVGSLYYPNQMPEPFFEALSLLNDGGTAWPPNFKVRFLGTEPGTVNQLAQRYGLERWVDIAPPVPHSKSLALQALSTALLYVGWCDPAEGFISAKIFEYMGTGRPVLAVGPPGGSISEILRECGIDDLSDNPAEIAARLESWIEEFKNHRRLSPQSDRNAAAKYTRRAQTERLARLLDRVAKHDPPSS